MNYFKFHSVGQGLFYTGSLMNGTYQFVYDCGTESKYLYIENCINNYVKTLPYRRSIDFVVISHLHKDHFSGLFYLLQNTNVKKIYLPYLGENSEVIRATLALSVFKDDDIEDDVEYKLSLYSFMCGLYGVDEGRDFIRYRELVAYISKDEKSNEYKDVVYATENFIISYKNKPYWQFNLIQSGTSTRKLNSLSNKLHDFFDKLGERDLILAIQKNNNVLTDLKGIYESVFGEGNALNLTSILLVHFPLYENAVSACLYNDVLFIEKFIKYRRYCKRSYCKINKFFYNRIFNKSVVTILTGDAMVDSIISSKISSIKGERENLILQVPHHGSKNNWLALKNSEIAAKLYIISYGYGNRHKHPSAVTVDSLIKDGKEFYCVNQRDGFIYFID